MGLQLYRGKVKNIRHSVEVSGSQNNISTSHVAVFELEGFMVELKLPDSIVINEGDEVKVAGKIKRGLFKGLAYQNVTKQVLGKGPAVLYMFLGVIFAIVGLCTIIFGIGAAFLAIGIYLVYKSRQYSKAYRMITA